MPPGLWPYLAPYGAFLLLVDLESRLDPSLAGWLLPLRVGVPAGLLLFFAWRGAYPELRSWRPGAGALADIAAGLVIAAAWVGPYLLGWLPRPAEPWDPTLYGDAGRPLLLGLRLVGFALVTPFMEELFVRSFLHRFADGRGRTDFRILPVGRFTAIGFAVTVVWFTFSHVSWEWPVAAATGVLFNGWLYLRRDLGACVIAHAVTNGAIWALVVFGPFDLWDFL